MVALATQQLRRRFVGVLGDDPLQRERRRAGDGRRGQRDRRVARVGEREGGHRGRRGAFDHAADEVFAVDELGVENGAARLVEDYPDVLSAATGRGGSNNDTCKEWKEATRRMAHELNLPCALALVGKSFACPTGSWRRLKCGRGRLATNGVDLAAEWGPKGYRPSSLRAVGSCPGTSSTRRPSRCPCRCAAGAAALGCRRRSFG